MVLDTTKSLRIVIDENMASPSHVDILSKTIASGIGAIKRIGPFVSPDIPHSFYNALVQPFTTCERLTFNFSLW